MRRLTWILLMTALVAALTGCGDSGIGFDVGDPAPADNVPDIVGEYIVTGVDPLGTDYGGVLEVSEADEPDTYVVRWIITGSIQEGTGVLEGNQLTVEWDTVETFTGESSGTATYTVTDEGVLIGTRQIDGFEREGEETAVPNEEEYNIGSQ